MTAQQLAISLCFVCALIGAGLMPNSMEQRCDTKAHRLMWTFVGFYTGAVAAMLLVTASALVYRVGLWASLLIQK